MKKFGTLILAASACGLLASCGGASPAASEAEPAIASDAAAPMASEAAPAAASEAAPDASAASEAMDSASSAASPSVDPIGTDRREASETPPN